MRFEWSEAKEQANRLKHGIGFDLAMTSFDDPFARIAVDERHSTPHETRERLIGESDDGILVVIFTRRSGGQSVRIISARRASRRERRLYEEYRPVSL
jgi:hypothetical protein